MFWVICGVVLSGLSRERGGEGVFGIEVAENLVMIVMLAMIVVIVIVVIVMR